MPPRDLDHPARERLLAELHARPAPRVSAPARAAHLALKESRYAANRDGDSDRALMRALTASSESDLAVRHVELDVAGYRVVWENHTEYAAYTAVRRLDDGGHKGDAGSDDGGSDTIPEPFGEDPRALFADEWLRQGVARRIAAVIVEVRAMPEDRESIPALVRSWFASPPIISSVLGGTGILAGDLTPDGDGYTRWMLFVDSSVGAGRTGRTLQRLFDLETYRMLALLGFDRSHELSNRLNELDPDLTSLITEMDDPTRPADEMLHELLALTARLEGLAMSHQFRFGATTAYASIVEDRLRALSEERFLGRQTLVEFLTRRYVPAIRTAQSAEQRLDRMLERSRRAAELLRTRLDVARAAQNQALLRSMDARSDLQLRLQTTVEGLSVIAVSYYLLGLLGYVLAPLAESTGVDRTWLLAVLAPLVLIGVWLGLRQAKRRLRH
ncbi:MAG: DUF3422 family protein [Dermatophilaceae bacterium]|nr:DUF3422 domain-containing protein [Intrasporangiaceae bacterium]